MSDAEVFALLELTEKRWVDHDSAAIASARETLTKAIREDYEVVRIYGGAQVLMADLVDAYEAWLKQKRWGLPRDM